MWREVNHPDRLIIIIISYRINFNLTSILRKNISPTTTYKYFLVVILFFPIRRILWRKDISFLHPLTHHSLDDLSNFQTIQMR